METEKVGGRNPNGDGPDRIGGLGTVRNTTNVTGRKVVAAVAVRNKNVKEVVTVGGVTRHMWNFMLVMSAVFGSGISV